MKRTRFCILAITMALLSGCSKSEKAAADKPAETGAEEHAASRVKRGTNGEVIITLDAETQKKMALQTAPLAPARLNPEIKGYGRVLDPSPLAVLAAELTTAEAATAASQAELRRLKTLAAQNNASERALQTAEAAAARDQAQVEGVRLRLLTSWGRAIAERHDLNAFVRSLSAQESALVEIDLPAGSPVKAMPGGARLVTLDSDSQPVEAQFLSPAAVAPSQLQGRGFLFLVAQNQSGLVPGAAVTGFLAIPGEPQPGVVVPANAVVRHNGAAWIYVQKGDDGFERVEVSLDRPLPNGWFTTSGLKPDDKVVIVGAQQLLSEELKGGGVD